MKTSFIIAEYCPAVFYTGWWLYERDRNDGTPNDNGAWGWLKDRNTWSNQAQARNLCSDKGFNPPQNLGDEFVEWFAATFPNGLKVQRETEHDPYQLIEVVLKRPIQKHRNIRTMRGAAMADRAWSKCKSLTEKTKES